MDESWPLTIPRETANDDFVILISWLVEEGSRVETGTPIALFETSKATVELTAPHAGYLTRTAAESTELPVGAPIGRIQATPSSALPRTNAADAAPSVLPAPPVIEPAPHLPTEVEPRTGQRWSRKAADLAKLHGLSPAIFADKALIREQDVLAAIEQQAVVPASVAAPPPTLAEPKSAQAAPGSAALGRVERIMPLSAVKRTEIRYLRAGNAEALVSAITVSVRSDGMARHIAAATDRRLTYFAFIVPAVARALREYPDLNSFLADDGIHYYADVNLGVAINLGEGLFVPVLHHADQLTSDEVARSVSTLIMKHVRGELREADLVGGTFTITDLTDAAALHVVPLLNRYQTAILAVGVDAERPDPRLLLTLAFDHRVSDGLQAAQFLGSVKHDLEGVAGPSTPPPVAQPRCAKCRTNLRRLREDGVADYLLSVVNEAGEQSFVCPTCFIGFTN